MHRQQEPLPSSEGIRFENLWQNAIVSSRVSIVRGTIRGGGNGSVITWYYNNTFPSQRFPVVDGQFKALVRLELGDNKILFESDLDRGSKVKQELQLRYQPILEDPPVHYCLMVAKDSPLTFDSPRYKKDKEGNGLDQAVAKMRMLAYMHASFTQEQMLRNGFGLRTFRPYEEFEPDSLSNRDQEKQRPTVHVHVVRMDRTVAEIQDPDVAQQNHNAKRSGDLFGWAADALQKYGGPFTRPFSQAACIYLDTHWDKANHLITGHAALGGNVGNLRLAIFGGHALHTWPKNFEDLVPCLMDSTRTDTNEVANDASESGTSLENLCVSQGAFMHEVGHLLGCPHEPDGIMLRGYLHWNRSFIVCEPGSTRCIGPRDEDYWNRLDIMRFRFHPSFRLPGEPRFTSTCKPVCFPLRNGLSFHCPNGIFMVDIQSDGSKGHFEYLDLPQEVTLTFDQIKQALKPEDRDKKLDLQVHAPGPEDCWISDIKEFVKRNASDSVVHSSTVGREDGDCRTTELPKDHIRLVRVWAGDALDGYEFIDTKGRSTFFGNQGGKPHDIPIADGDELVGIAVRGGYWIDAGGIITRNGRSPLFGGPGGSLTDLVPPRGHRLTGISGFYTNWAQGIRILYSS